MTPERLVTPAREDGEEDTASGWWSLRQKLLLASSRKSVGRSGVLDAITDRYLERLYAPRERAA